MKKTAKKIAMAAVILMLAAGFTGCFTTAVVDYFPIAAVVTVPLDIITSPVQLVIYIVENTNNIILVNKAAKADSFDTFSDESFFYPKDNLLSLKEKFDSLPDEEIAFFTETINSFSEKEISALINAYKNLSEEEIIASAEILNSMSDEMLIAALNSFKDIDFNKLN